MGGTTIRYTDLEKQIISYLYISKDFLHYLEIVKSHLDFDNLGETLETLLILEERGLIATRLKQTDLSMHGFGRFWGLTEAGRRAYERIKKNKDSL